MSESEKSYLGYLDHNAFEYTPKFFVGVLAGYLVGWRKDDGVKLDSVNGREMAMFDATHDYGGGFVHLRLLGFDNGTFRNAAGVTYQQVPLVATFNDQNDWYNSRSEEAVASAMWEMSEAIAKLTGNTQFWQRGTGYWRCGAALYSCPSIDNAEPEFLAA